VADDGNGLSAVQAHAVENLGMAGDLVMRDYRAVERGIDIENARDRPNASENAILLGNHRANGALVGIDAGIAGRIARCPVFEQRILKYGGDAA